MDGYDLLRVLVAPCHALLQDPAKRPSASEVLTSAWMKDVLADTQDVALRTFTSSNVKQFHGLNIVQKRMNIVSSMPYLMYCFPCAVKNYLFRQTMF